MATRRDDERLPLVVEVIVVKRADPFTEPQVAEPGSRVDSVSTPCPPNGRTPVPDTEKVETDFQSIEAAKLCCTEPGAHIRRAPALGVALLCCGVLLGVSLLGGTGVVKVAEPVQSEAALGTCVLAFFLGSHAAQRWLHGG